MKLLTEKYKINALKSFVFPKGHFLKYFWPECAFGLFKYFIAQIKAVMHQ